MSKSSNTVSLAKPEAPRITDPSFPIPVELHSEVSQQSLIAYLAMAVCADGSGYCEHAFFKCSMAGLSLVQMKESLAELEQARFIQIIKTPNLFGSRTDAQLLGIPVKTKLSRLDPASWNRLRERVFERDNWTCRYCGYQAVQGDSLECDHVIPISKGGTNEMGNLAAACEDCNASKRGLLIENWKSRSA